MSKKFAAIGFLLVVVSLLSAASVVAKGASSDPCDGYGNCISSSISYVRSNPDGSLYLGDEFAVTPSVSLGPNTTSYSYSLVVRRRCPRPRWEAGCSR